MKWIDIFITMVSFEYKQGHSINTGFDIDIFRRHRISITDSDVSNQNLRAI